MKSRERLLRDSMISRPRCAASARALTGVTLASRNGERRPASTALPITDSYFVVSGP